MGHISRKAWRQQCKLPAHLLILSAELRCKWEVGVSGAGQQQGQASPLQPQAASHLQQLR